MDTQVETREVRPLGSLQGKRILVSGKGGSGKSTFVVLLSAALRRMDYRVMVLDGDASNPEGLVRLLFGTGTEGEPEPLLEFFGGLERVACPVDDPSPLTRVDDADPVPTNPIRLSEELGPEYMLARDDLWLLQVGKIETYGQGCDGPLEKVVRDFIVRDDVVSVIDEKAGVEHFGRRIPDRMDAIICVLDYTRESVSIANRIDQFAREIGEDGEENLWYVLNKTESEVMESEMMHLLGDLGPRVIGSIPYTPDLMRAALSGKALNEDLAREHMDAIATRLQVLLAERG